MRLSGRAWFWPAPAAPGFETIRLTNIRANAQGLGAGAPIAATINITSPTSVPVNNNSLVVANIRQGLTFTVTPATFKSCVEPEEDEGFTLNFAEGFGTAFKPQRNLLGDRLRPTRFPAAATRTSPASTRRLS